jgi:hypothetical protein
MELTIVSAVAAPERKHTAHAGRPAREAGTLEAIVLGAWDELVDDGRCACPVCGSRMSLESPSPQPSGRCESCGSALS